MQQRRQHRCGAMERAHRIEIGRAGRGGGSAPIADHARHGPLPFPSRRAPMAGPCAIGPARPKADDDVGTNDLQLVVRQSKTARFPGVKLAEQHIGFRQEILRYLGQLQIQRRQLVDVLRIEFGDTVPRPLTLAVARIAIGTEDLAIFHGAFSPYRYPRDGKGERPWNRVAQFNSQNVNKLSLALDLKLPGGKDVMLNLLAKSDVLLANFTPGTLARLGLSYDELKVIVPTSSWPRCQPSVWLALWHMALPLVRRWKWRRAWRA